ncbi:glutamate ABC transporter substrate-binding protein [Corynebacterium caspium]|uniref:glutamate ABC transporter substrate-binding protein n=1 Tax=Corynebacterium caspium TaxID=234828 RepID=UPI000360D290|nr:glutamate ABC transporter substrate-binding protein [Corynebacterium caspium]WKD59239.1 ABC transporter glutamine-binding protein GlnH precursor [Corynebacterium caspium DSM 44850]
MLSTKFRAIATLSAVVLSATLLTSCGDSASADKTLLKSIESGNVTLGSKYDQPGLGLREGDGSMTGLDIDVATYVINHIAEKNGWSTPKIEWRESPSAQRETLIQNGEVDLIAATYSINPSRAESVNFGGPYLLTHQALLTQQSNTEIKGLADLDGKILCSVTGSTPAQKIKEALPTVQLQEYDTYSSCVEALSQGNVDALSTDATILNGYAAQTPGAFKVVKLEKEGKPFTNEYYGIGLKKNDEEGTKAINEALEEMLESGEFDKFVSANLGAGDEIDPGTPGDLSFLKS